jgi:glycogen debranching enzyme
MGQYGWNEEIVERAYEISRDTVVNNCATISYDARGAQITARLLLAGNLKFNEYWVRDCLAAPETMLELGLAEELRNCIAAPLNLQLSHEDTTSKLHGRIPRKLSAKSDLRRNLEVGIPFLPKQRSTHFTPQYTTAHGIGLGPATNPLDSYAHVIIAAGTYVTHTGHIEFALDYMGELDTAMQHLSKHFDGELIVQPPHGGWNDHWHYKGKALLIQLQYLQACKAMGDLKAACGTLVPDYEGEARMYAMRAAQFKEIVNEHYWDDMRGYFITAVEPMRENFSTLENSLALKLVADPAQAVRIVEKFKDVYHRQGYIPIHTPQLPRGDALVSRYLTNAHYITGDICLPWNVCTAAGAIAHVDPAFAATLLDDMAQKIVRLRNAEALQGDKPKKRFFTKDEPSFTWGAKCYMEAVQEVMKRQNVLMAYAL